MMEYLVRGSYDGSYYGTGVESYEILSEKEWNTLQEALDNNYVFWVHEWSGKHSESEVVASECVELITTDPVLIDNFRKIFESDSIGNLEMADYIIERWLDSEERYELNEGRGR